MYSVHMVQHLLITLIAVPLLLLGTPAWLARWILLARAVGGSGSCGAGRGSCPR